MIKPPAVSGRHSPKQNHLLAALPAADYERVLPDLELVPLPLGWAVYEAGGKFGYIYFPTTSIVSLLYVMEDGSSAEIAVTGNDGLVGIALSWVGKARPAAPWYKAPATATASGQWCSKGSSSKAASYSIWRYAIPRH
jgi:hypothetical protein